MKILLAIALLLSACTHHGVTAPPFSPPDSAPTQEELLRAIPADLYRGEITATSRENDQTQYLYFVFLKEAPEDQVPMRVALYANARGEALQLQFVARTPFADGDCRRGECRARIAEMPDGFQLSRESFGADHLRADYRFRRAGQDLELLGRGFQTKNDRGEICSVFYDYTKHRILHRRGKEARPEKMPIGPAPRLIQDRLRFETAVPETLCSLPVSN